LTRHRSASQQDDSTTRSEGEDTGVAQLEGERRQLDAQALHADRLALMGTLAAGVAHEVNNPLGITLANLAFALDELRQVDGDLGSLPGDTARGLGEGGARARGRLKAVIDALEEARQGGDRVRLLVRDLQTFAGGAVERPSPVDVGRVMEAAMAVAHNVIRARATLVRDYVGSPIVHGNEAHLAQVFLNLLLNAAEAIPDGNPDLHEIRVALRTDAGGCCVVEVSDTGRGIAPEHLGRVFDPFFTTKPGSVGLGLSMSHTIVDSLGGSVSVESPPGRGTTFRVTLPAVMGQAAPASSTRAATQPARRARVLVVDDEPMMTRAVHRLLRSEHDVETTTDPVGVVERVRAGERFDVILCDLMMPAMTGMDVHEAVLAIDAEQARRMVFMTGGAFTTRAARFLENVDNPRLEKPIERAILTALIRAHVP
jgi:signal transduction histidine kinase/CheY-like chemotaxis protein